MSDDLRGELAELSRLLQTHLAWQRELGVAELPRVASAPEPVAEPRGPVASAPEPVAEPRVPVASAPEPVAEPRAPVASAPVVAAQAPVAVTAAPTEPEELPPTRAGRLAVIQREVAACAACGLAARRTNTVFSRGDPEARVMFVGEAPGEQEDKQGVPFVGPAGQLLDRIIVAMTLDPASVYICNIVKCRPPGNRTPSIEEVDACTPFLRRQLALVKPELIVALGRTAAHFLLDTKASMSSLRGRWHEYEGVPLLPTWHPSYLLREPSRKAETWADMKLVMARLGLAVPGRR